MCETVILIVILCCFGISLKVFEPLFQIFGGCFSVIISFFALFFYFVLWTEQPILAVLLTAAIVFVIYLVNLHSREKRKRAAELKLKAENERIKAHQPYMTEYFERRVAIIKQFNHLD